MTETYVFFPFQTSMSVHRQMVAVNTPVSTLTSPSTASVSKDTLSRQIKRLVKVNKTRPFCFQDQDEHFLRFNDDGADFGVLKTSCQHPNTGLILIRFQFFLHICSAFMSKFEQSS